MSPRNEKDASCGEKKISPLPGIEPRFLGPPARSLVTILHYATLDLRQIYYIQSMRNLLHLEDAQSKLNASYKIRKQHSSA